MDTASDDRLDAMLAAGRITQAEYGRLREAMRRTQPRPRPPLAKCMAERQVFGVCAGLARHYRVNPWGLRLLFVLALPVAFWAYVILYLVLPWDESGAPSEFSMGNLFMLVLVGVFAVAAGVWSREALELLTHTGYAIPALSWMSLQFLLFFCALPQGGVIWLALILLLSWLHSVSRQGSAMKRVLGRWVPIGLAALIAGLLFTALLPLHGLAGLGG